MGRRKCGNLYLSGAQSGVWCLVHKLLDRRVHLGRRKNLYIFSNTSISHAEFWRNEYSELLKHFQKIFLSFELGTRKPEKESFLEVCSQIDVLPEKILFFDDTEENIVAANDLGMNAVKVDSMQDINETIEKLC